MVWAEQQDAILAALERAERVEAAAQEAVEADDLSCRWKVELADALAAAEAE